MKTTGNRSHFKYIIILLLYLNSTLLFSQKHNKLNITFTPNYSFVNKKNVSNASAELTTGVNILYSHPKKRGFISYGIEYNTHKSTKENIPDNRTVIDNNGVISDKNIKYFKVQFSYNYIAPQILYNYTLKSGENFSLGAAAGIKLKYFFNMETEYFLKELKLTTKTPISNIYEGNIFLDTPSALANLWFNYNFNKTLGFNIELKYSRDLHFSKIPQHTHLGVGFGVFTRW